MDQKNVWDAIARDWKIYRDTPPQPVLDFLGDLKGNILDLGCGGGRNFIAREGLTFFGHDFSEKMISYAQERAAGKNISVQLTVGETGDIPYEEEFFDHILCSAVLHCVETAEKRFLTIKEMYRVLKPGGQAFISVWGRGSPRLTNRAKESYIPWKADHERYTYIFEKKELEVLCKKIGFEIVKSWEDENITMIVQKDS